MRCRRSATTRRVAVAWIAAGACLLAAGCSPGADYPSLFPAVHDMPPSRADAPLDPVQVQQATEDLINERDHLTAETQGTASDKGTATPKSASPAATAPAGTKRAKTQAGQSQAAQSQAGQKTGTAANAGSGGFATTAGTETAGVESK